MAQYTLPTTKKYEKPVEEAETTEPKKPATLDDLLAQQPEGGYLGQGMRDLADLGYAAQRGITKGVISVPAVFGEIERLQRMGLRGVGVDVSPEPFLYGMKEYQSLIPSLATEARTPTARVVEKGLEYGVGAGVPMALPAKGAQALSTAARYATGGLAGLSRVPRSTAPATAVTQAPTVASEALQAGKLFGGIGATAGVAEEMAGETAGTATGLGLTGLTILGSLLRKSPATIAKQAVETIDPADIQRARDLQKVASEQGIPLSAFETLPSNQLRELADFVARSPEGQGLLGFMAGRQADIKPAIMNQIDTIQQTSRTKPEVANAAQKAADDYIDAARGNVTAATTDLYEAAKIQNIEPQLVSDIVKQLRDKKKLVGKDTAKAIDDMIGRLTGKGGRVVTNIGVLHDELKRLDAIIDMPALSAADATQKSVYGNLKDPIKSLRDALNTNPNQMAANAMFKERLTAFENMLGETGIEALNKANIKPKSAYRVVTDFEQVDPANIKAISTALNSQDPTIFPDLVRMWMENSADKAFKISATGEIPASAGVKFAQSIRGTDQARANLDAILDSVAEAQGVNATELKTGFNDMLDVLERTNILAPTGSRTATRGMLKEEIEGGAGLLGVDITAPTKGVSQMLQDMRRRNAVRRLSEVFTDEDSISALLKLAAEKDVSRKIAIVGGLFTTVREATQPDTGLLADQQVK